METVFVLCFAQKEFMGSGFALWRLLFRHSLPREIHSMEEGSIGIIKIPVRSEDVPYMGVRTRRLLYRRLEQTLTPGALIFCRERGAFPEFVGTSDERLVKSIGAHYLPEVFSAIRRQWGTSFFGTSAAVVSGSGDFLPLACALSPFVRSIDVITTGVPNFGGQDYAWEEWGLTVCFRDDVPKESPLVILWDAEQMDVSVPEGAFTIDFSGAGKGDIEPENIFFHVPADIVPISGALGGMTMPSLARFGSHFYEEDNVGERLSERGFSVSRVERNHKKMTPGMRRAQ